MPNEAHNTADTIRPLGSNHDDSSSMVQLSAKTRARLEKLARWRMDPASLKFLNLGPNIEGGYAIVSRALLASTSDETTGQLLAPSDGDAKSSDRIAKLKGDNGGQDIDRSNEEARKEGKGEADGEEHESDDEACRRLKAVAVKKMKIETPDEILRVLGLTLREAEFLVKLSHNNIIKLEGFVEDVSKEMIWLVFPWEENGNLKDFVALYDWAVPERLALIYDVTAGVQYMHSRSPPICHADLKSINILVNAQCRAVITDFGSAHYPATNGLNKKSERAMEEPRTAPPVEASFCTSTNTITLTGIQCTTRWAAPEVLERDEFSMASDIWALGWVAYEVRYQAELSVTSAQRPTRKQVMTNSIPFHDVKEPMVVNRVVLGDLPSISNDVRLLLIQELCSIVGQCWQLDPSKRPTAKNCQDSIFWMPRITPNLNPVHTKDVAGSVDHSAGLLMRLGDLYKRQNDHSNASNSFTKALEIYTKVSDRNGTADALCELAQIHRFQHEYDQAVLHYTKALGIYSELSNRRGRATVIWSLAVIHGLRSEYSQAITFYSEAAQIYTEIGNRGGRADALWGLAEVHRVRNEYSQAVAFYSECLQIRTDIGDRRGRANALWGLASVHRARNEYSQAVAFYSECIQIRTNIGDSRGRASALWGLAEVHRLQKEYTQAMPLFSEALKIFNEIGDRYGSAFTLQCMGDAHRDQHDHSSAIHHYEQAAKIYKQIGNPSEPIVLERAVKLRRLMEQEAKGPHDVVSGVVRRSMGF